MLKVRKKSNPVRERIRARRFLRVPLRLPSKKRVEEKGLGVNARRKNEGGECFREPTNEDGNTDDDENASESPEGGFDGDDDDDDVRRRLFCRCIVQR